MIIGRYTALYSLQSSLIAIISFTSFYFVIAIYFIYFLPTAHGLYRAGIIAIFPLRKLWHEEIHILQTEY